MCLLCIYLQDLSLVQAFDVYGQAGRSNGPDWQRIADTMGNRRSALAYRQRYVSVLVPRINKFHTGPWSAEEVRGGGRGGVVVVVVDIVVIIHILRLPS